MAILGNKSRTRKFNFWTLKVNKMEKKRAKANTLEKNKEKAHFYASEVLPYYEEIRNHVDELERLIDDEKWPIPKYRELIFVR